MEGYMTLEEAIHAYYTNGVVNLPESDAGDFEFDAAPSANDLSDRDNLTPTSIDRCDMAAEISRSDYSKAFPMKESKDPSVKSPEVGSDPAPEPAPPTS